MNRYKLLDIIRRTSIVKKRDFYLRLMNEPNLNAIAIAMQKDKLISFLKRLRANDYYGPLLERFTDFQIESSPYDVLKSLPLSDKASLTQNYNLVRNTKYPGEKSYTGGSTGSPFHYFSGKSMLSSLTGYTMFLWSYLGGYDWDDDVIVIGGISIGDKRNLKKDILHFLQRRRFISGGEIDEKNTIALSDLINNARKPIILYGYPSSISQYITLIERMHIYIDTNKIKIVLTTSETLSDDRRLRIQRFFKSEVINLYGARDGGISAGSADNKSFIYNGVDCVAETIEIDGVKELILTNLDSEAFPFVRYRIGDIADVLISHNGYPFILENLQGRTRDFIHLSQNRKIHGSQINKVFMNSSIVEYQICQHKDYSCDVYIQPRSELSDDELSTISSNLKQLLEGISIRIQVADNLVREKNNKLKNIVSEIKD